MVFLFIAWLSSYDQNDTFWYKLNFYDNFDYPIFHFIPLCLHVLHSAGLNMSILCGTLVL